MSVLLPPGPLMRRAKLGVRSAPVKQREAAHGCVVPWACTAGEPPSSASSAVRYVRSSAAQSVGGDAKQAAGAAASAMATSRRSGDRARMAWVRGLTLEVRRTQGHGPARCKIHHCASRGHALACRLDRPVRPHGDAHWKAGSAPSIGPQPRCLLLRPPTSATPQDSAPNIPTHRRLGDDRSS